MVCNYDMIGRTHVVYSVDNRIRGGGCRAHAPEGREVEEEARRA